MGRHYPDLEADPVLEHGYYYSARYRKLARLKPGDKLPRHMGPWEFIARDDEGSSSEVLERLRRRHPNLDPYRLTFTTSTPVDPRHLSRSRSARRRRYFMAITVALGLGWALRQILPGRR